DDGYKAAALSAIAESYAKLGEIMKDSSLLADAIETAERISNDFPKAAALRAIAASIAKLAESSNDRTLYDKIFGFIEVLGDDDNRDTIIDTILSSKFAVADVSKLRSLTSHFSSEAGKAKALAHILIACSYPELIGRKEQADDDNDR